MEEEIRKAFDFAADASKQIMTLSTGMIALTIAFKKDFMDAQASPRAKLVLYAAWALYCLSVFFGIWTLQALTGTLDQEGCERKIRIGIRGCNVTRPAGLQAASFLLALALTTIFAALSLNSGS